MLLTILQAVPKIVAVYNDVLKAVLAKSGVGDTYPCWVLRKKLKFLRMFYPAKFGYQNLSR